MAEERVQRRLAAILAADVVGYSRLIGLDETGTRARFNEHLQNLIEPAIDEHRGRLVKTMGDGFLVEFGSVVDAVQCATDIQNAIALNQNSEPEERKMLFRIGIHLGDVIVEGEDIHGDGVNIASRLEALAETGGICVTDMVRVGVGNRVALEFTDLGEQSLKNIAEPVRIYRVGLGERATSGAAASDALFRRPAVAVLPFENMSGDAEQEYFSDGLTEDIITALCLWRSFPVIARNSTFAYKGQSPDIRKVGKELGARYVVEGSVRKAGDRVRVTAQLINAETGHHVWAERYDRDLADIFDLQDELTAQIAAIVAPELERAEHRQMVTKPPRDFSAWDYCVNGEAQIYELTKAGNEKAREMFLRAIECDPNYARGYTGLAWAYANDLRFFGATNREKYIKLLQENARRAVHLDDNDAEARNMLVRAHFWLGDMTAAVAEAQNAVRLNPYNAMANNMMGTSLALFSSRYDEGIPWYERALQLNPTGARRQVFLSQLALSHLGNGNPETALRYVEDAIRHQPDFAEALVAQASILGYLGRIEEAKKALEKAGDVAVDMMKRHGIYSEALKEVILDGLRKAGWEG